VQRARQIIVENLKVPIVGVVLNQVPSGTGEDYGYYTANYSYYRHDAAEAEAPKDKGTGRGADRLEMRERREPKK
jgi:hypothetical protein